MLLCHNIRPTRSGSFRVMHATVLMHADNGRVDYLHGGVMSAVISGQTPALRQQTKR